VTTPATAGRLSHQAAALLVGVSDLPARIGEEAARFERGFARRSPAAPVVRSPANTHASTRKYQLSQRSIDEGC
jgi:hypothetical protein